MSNAVMVLMTEEMQAKQDILRQIDETRQVLDKLESRIKASEDLYESDGLQNTNKINENLYRLIATQNAIRTIKRYS